MLKQQTIHRQMFYLRKHHSGSCCDGMHLRGLSPWEAEKKTPPLDLFFFPSAQSPPLQKQYGCDGRVKLNVITPRVREKKRRRCWSWSGIQSNPDGQLTFPLIQAKWSAQVWTPVEIWAGLKGPCRRQRVQVHSCVEEWSVHIQHCAPFLSSLSACNVR